jgi:alpha-glucosidase (family GH31 glycosyl hydrolase)
MKWVWGPFIDRFGDYGPHGANSMNRLACCLVFDPAILWLCFITATASGQMASVRYRDQDAELSINQVSERTFQIVFAQLEESTGEPRQAPPSSVVVEQQLNNKMRARKLEPSQTFDVGKLRIVVAADPLKISVRRRSGETIQDLAFDSADGTMTFRAQAPVLGMGEGAQQFDRRGARYTMRDGWGAWERPTHGSWVAVPFLVGTDGWAMLVHHPLGEFDLREANAKFTPWIGQESPLVAYVIAWDEPRDVMCEYARLVGPAPLPPKWALGYMQSHRTLAGPDEVLGVARTLREKKLPCDALIYLGTGYCPAGWNTGHASVDFNPATFDKPAEIIDALHDQHFRIVLHQNAPPRELTGLEVQYVELDKADSESGRPNRRRSDISQYWARHRKTFALGIDGWWPDDGDELRRESRIARHRLYYQGPLLDRPNVRPWNLQRTGYAGVQRYGGWIWTGDIDSRWATLAKQVPIGQNHGLSLSPYWGTDIGGFYPTRELTGELYVRWFQFGTFCPSYRAHGRTWHLRLPWGWNTGEQGPDEHNRNVDPAELHNTDVEPICRKYLELRYQLLPYTYTLCREAHDTGLPLIRALWLHYPKDSQAVARSDEYLWGDALLVAPIVKKGETERTLYLPEGDWYDFWTNERHAGGREITRAVDLATMPLYVRAGTILPLDPVRQYTSEPTEEPTTIRIYPGRDGEYRLYDDDGESLDYKKGKFAWTRFAWDDGQKRLTIEPDKSAGSMDPPARKFSVELMPGGERKTVQYDGRRIEIGI